MSAFEKCVIRLTDQGMDYGLAWNICKYREEQGILDPETGEPIPGETGPTANGVPITRDDDSMKFLIAGLVAIKIAKMPGGLKMLEALGRQFLKGIFGTLHALGQASAANKVSAWANPYLVSMVLDRFGFINPRYYLEYKVGLSLISGANVAEGFLDSIQGVFPFTKPEPSEFPQNIYFSSPDDITALRRSLAETE